MKKIRVLLYGMSSNLGGIETFCKNLIFNSTSSKIRFTLLVEGEVVVPFQNDLLSYGVKIVRFCPRTKNYIRYLNDLKKIYKKGGYDIVHINLMTYSPFEIVKYACKYSSAKVIVHSHSAGYKNGYRKARLLHLIGKKALRNCNFEKVACGDEAGKYLFGGSKYQVFHNGVDFKKFLFSSENRKEIRDEVGLKKGDFVIGNVASFSPPKNHEFLLRVFCEIRKRIPDAKLVLVGDGELLERNRQLAKEMGVCGAVRFLGRRVDTYKIYSALDAYVMPSFREGLSISLCEAQVNGLPCFVSYGSNMESDISGNVEFVELGDPEEWAKKIEAACNMARKTVGKKIEAFELKKCVNIIYEYYMDLIGDR